VIPNLAGNVYDAREGTIERIKKNILGKVTEDFRTLGGEKGRMKPFGNGSNPAPLSGENVTDSRCKNFNTQDA